jgi:hypothetical protein
MGVEIRAVGRIENPGVPVLFGGHNPPPLVEIGLTDLPKSGGACHGTPGTPGDDISGDGQPRRAGHYPRTRRLLVHGCCLRSE